jgi:hypothetical protein
MLYCMQGGPILLKNCFLEIDIPALKDLGELFIENMQIMEFSVIECNKRKHHILSCIFRGVMVFSSFNAVFPCHYTCTLLVNIVIQMKIWLNCLWNCKYFF